MEADEQLQLLDEDIVKLEREAGNTKLLKEIFRAAHTLKGSSAMLGHNRMSQVAHALESVLDKFRKGTLKVTPDVVDALLNGLDVLPTSDGKPASSLAKYANTGIPILIKRLKRASVSRER